MLTVPETEPTPESELRVRLGLGERTVLFAPGATRPHKNAAALIDALATIPAQGRPTLVVTGYSTRYEADLQKRVAARGLNERDVVLPGWLGSADLEGLYAVATAVLVPSRYEGFGLPILEAMTRGVPVACSDRSSLPEVAGGAALVFPPDDPSAIRRSIDLLLSDRELRARLRSAGYRRAATFTWERTAELTALSYEKALSS